MVCRPDRVFVVGYPGEIGGACTELWHTIKLWRRFGLDVHLIPTWVCSEAWREKVQGIGCLTHDCRPEILSEVPGLAGSIVVSFCNAEFLNHASVFKELGCRTVWVNCMTFLFEAELRFYREHGLFDAFVFQSEFQREQLVPRLRSFGFVDSQGRLIRGAFDFSELEFRPRPRSLGDPFVIGRMARPDLDKWSSNTWPIYSAIQYADKRALMLGMNDAVHAKLGAAPLFADCLEPMAMPVTEYLSQLHCLLPINGGARENWPRAGLEAMAAGVPIVAQNLWGWREMIEHGVTGFLANNDCELAHYTACLAYDEELRQRVIHAARKRLMNELAQPKRIWEGWVKLFSSLEGKQATPNSSGNQLRESA